MTYKINEIRNYLRSGLDFTVGDIYGNSFTIGFDGDDEYKNDANNGSIIKISYNPNEGILSLGYRNVNQKVKERIHYYYPFGEFPDFGVSNLETLKNQIEEFITKFTTLVH